MFDYFISLRRADQNEPGGLGAEPGPTRFLEVPSQAVVPHIDHKIDRETWIERVMEIGRCADCDPVTGEPTGDILVFIHGYNNRPEAVLTRHRQLSTNLAAAGYTGAVVSFDWPSNDVGINYLEDRSDARQTSIRLVDDCIRLFTVTQARGCCFNVHLLAHSTGAYVIREGFDDADDRRNIASVNWTVSQIAFIGADVSRRSMSLQDSKSSSIYRHCVRLTNYQNPFDSVLKLSNIKRVGVAPRAGRVGIPDEVPSKAVNVNCGRHFEQLEQHPDAIGAWSHAWHFTDMQFIKDLALTIHGDIDRRYIPTRRVGDIGLELEISSP